MQSLLQRLLLGNAGGGGGGNPTLNYNFVDGSAFPSAITFSRGSNATQFDSTGSLVYAPNNAIRNNTMVGAVAGTPGTLPTNWQITNTSGLSSSVIGFGSESGVNYIDIRVFGTSTGNTFTISPEAGGVIAASNGQTWTASQFLRLVGGSTANILSFELGWSEQNSVPSFLAFNVGTISIPTTGSLAANRIIRTGTNGQATTAFVRPVLNYQFNSGVAIDITLRIGMPQLEIGPVVTAVNATSGTAYYGPRLDYAPATLAAQGLLIEEQRTNSIRNSTMQGAVAGTPGTLPTNWTYGQLTTLTTEIVSVGTETGISYVDIRISGTATTTPLVYFEANSTVAATNGQTWATSVFVKIVGGSTTNITVPTTTLRMSDSGGANLGFIPGAAITLPTSSAALAACRFSSTHTTNNASTAFVMPALAFNAAGAIDITLRIGLPQLELGAFATSVIPTTTTALTRSADVASVNTLSPWFNATAGTLFAEYIVTNSAQNNSASSLSDNTNDNRMLIRATNSSAQTVFIGVAATVTQWNDVIVSALLNTPTKSALAYATNDIAWVRNGGAVGTDTSATIPTVNRLQLGLDGAGTLPLNGYLRRITYYPVRLTNAALQQITT